MSKENSCIAISIHAPLRERQSCAFIRFLVKYFNPRSLAGATEMFLNICSTPRAFQSTLPCGSDKDASLRSGGRKNFNPRSLAGATSQQEH